MSVPQVALPSSVSSPAPSPSSSFRQIENRTLTNYGFASCQRTASRPSIPPSSICPNDHRVRTLRRATRVVNPWADHLRPDVDTKHQSTPPQRSWAVWISASSRTTRASPGLILKVPANADGRRCHEDDTYAFEVLLIHMGDASEALRCDVRPATTSRSSRLTRKPRWAAGYIHQGLTEYVAEFVRWRLGGGELTWAQRQGVPEVDSEPCSASLSGWIGQQLSLRRNFDAYASGGPSRTSHTRSTPWSSRWSLRVTTAHRSVGRVHQRMALERPGQGIVGDDRSRRPLGCHGPPQHPGHCRPLRHVTALRGLDQLLADDGRRRGRCLGVVWTS